MPCHTDREKESACRVTMPLWHSEAERLPHPGFWPPAEAQSICLQRLHVVVGTGQAPRGSTHDLLPNFPFVKRRQGTEALQISLSVCPTCSNLMVGRTNTATQGVPLLGDNPRARGTKKNLANYSKIAENEGEASREAHGE